MDHNEARKTHLELELAGFRSFATAAGFLQLTRELKAAGVIKMPAIERVREAMLCELLANVPRSLLGDAKYEDRLRHRLNELLTGSDNFSVGGTQLS